MRQGIQNRKKHRALITLLAVALVAAVVFPVGGKIARAEGTYSLDVAGGGTEEIIALSDADMQVDIYKIADGTKDPTYDTWHWTLTGPYADLSFDEKTITNDGYAQLAKDAAKIALNGDDIEATKSQSASSGKVSFSGLEPGLYVIIPRDNSQEENKDILDLENIQTAVNTSELTYTYNPSITAIPSKDAIDGKIGTAADYGPWKDRVEVVLKPSISPRLGNLEIVKTLKTFETKDPATFVFSIEATKGTDPTGKPLNVYSDVVSITFDKPGEQTRLVSGIPVGANVRVTEVYSGASYEIVDTDEFPESQDVVIVADDVDNESARVAFKNDYDDTYHGGGGIENQFEYKPSESGKGEPWVFTQVVNGVEEKKIVNGEVKK